MAINKYTLSTETKNTIEEFEKADTIWKTAWEQFEIAHQQELEKLEQLREERNVCLESARKSLRAETQELSYADVQTVITGRFRAQKIWSSFYSRDKFLAKIRDKGLYDDAVSNGIVTTTVTVADFAQVRNFLEQRKLLADFEECEDGREKTTAIFGPKPIPSLGAESKET